jgi:plastocyanin
MIRRTLLLSAALVPVVGLLPSTSAAPAPPSEATVVVKDSPLSFAAKTLVLQLGKEGTATVTWQWETGSVRPHNVEDDKGTFNSHPGCGDEGFYGLGTGFASCGFTAATAFTQTFRKPGTYRYHCAIHGGPGQGMAGIVVVKAALKPKKR